MTTLASLSQDDLAVEPGSSVSLTVRVRNDGTVVDCFSVVPIGIPQEWVRCTPDELSLFPGAEDDVDVTIAPPRLHDVAPGPRRFALQVRSAEDPEGSVVEEGSLEVLPFTAPTAELHPRTSSARGRAAGRHRVAVDNRGNVPVEVRVRAADRDELLTVTAAPEVLVVEPGTAAFVALRARARKGFWRGAERTVPFGVSVVPDDGPAIELDALLVQQPRIPRWLPKAVGALVLLAVLAAALWQGVLKPAVEDEAREAAAAQVAPLEKDVDELQERVPPAGGGGATPGPPQTPPPSTAPTPAPGPSTPAPVDPLGDPQSARLELRPDRQSTRTSFGESTVFSLTDLVLSNPRGHEGLLTLRRDDVVLLQTDLANFRDLDYHFVAPLVFAPGEDLRVGVECAAPATGCSAAVFVSGYGKPAPTPSPAP